MNEDIIKQLLTAVRCGVCGGPYIEQDIYVLGHRDELWFLGILCPVCHTQSVVATIVKEGELSEIYAGPGDGELAEDSEGVAIQSDDVVDMHDFLKEFDGNFAGLFTGR